MNFSDIVMSKFQKSMVKTYGPIFDQKKKIPDDVELGEKLYQACETGDDNLAKKLISQGADVLWSNKNGRTPSD